MFDRGRNRDVEVKAVRVSDGPLFWRRLWPLLSGSGRFGLRLVIAVAAFAAYCVVFFALELVAGIHALLGVVVPVIVAGWLLGPAGGATAGVLAAPLMALLYGAVGQSPREVLLGAEGLTELGAVVASGLLSGLMSATLRRLQERTSELLRSRRDAVRQEQRAETLVRVAARLNSRMDLAAVAEAVSEETSRALGGMPAGLFLQGEHGGALRLASLAGLPEGFRSAHLSMPRHWLRQACERGDRRPVVVDKSALSQSPDADLYADSGVLALACAPLLRDGTLEGALGVFAVGAKSVFDDDELSLLEAIADHAAQAVSNARLFERLKARNRELEALRSLSEALRGATSDEEVAVVVRAHAREAVRADAAGVGLLDSSGEAIVGYADGFLAQNTGRVFRVSGGLTPSVLGANRPFVTEDLAAEPQLKRTISGIERCGPAVIVPLRAEHDVLGMVMAARERGHGKPFSPPEVRLLGTLADVAASTLRRVRLLRETELRLKLTEALRNIDMAITSSLDLRVTLNVILDHVTSQLSVDAADILLLEPHTQTLEFAAGRGLRTDPHDRRPEGLGETPAGRAVTERTIIHIPDIQREEQTVFSESVLLREGFVSYWAVPLVAKGKVNGVLEVFHRKALSAQRPWMSFLEALAGQAAIAIDNAGLLEDLHSANVELRRAYDATLESWARLLELRDHETAGHSERVADLTVRIAMVLGMSDEEALHCRRGALLHDIGKIGVPDSILLKPGKLTEDEWEVMRGHCELAYRMLSPIRYLRPALAIPLSHHEKWDGTGYPQGLKGTEIPLEARIFGVVDVWDALCSDRPYRKAWPKHKAFDYIRENAGTEFDPEVVEAFLKVVGESSVS